MTAALQPESKSPSRRAVLVGALGGLGAWAASAIGRASPVRAGVDGDVILGVENDATTTTSIVNSSNSATVFWASNGEGGQAIGVHGDSGSNYGVFGQSISSRGVFGSSESGPGVYGSSSSNIGVGGFSDTNTAVYGNSGASVGLYGDSSATNQPASAGRSLGHSTGVQGYSGTGSPPAAKAKTGVFGYAGQDASSVGVRGESPAGFGVYGKTTGTGFAGYFNGKVYMTQFLEMGEIATPVSPAANKARLFIKDNGLGKTQLVVKFANGSLKVLATES